jgi:hypothetical protein
MMKTKEISETLVFNATLIWLITREDFSSFIHHESLKSYFRKEEETMPYPHYYLNVSTILYYMQL